MEFYYQGRDRDGVAVDGVCQAETSDDVASQLFRKNITPIRILKRKLKINLRAFFKFQPRRSKIHLEELMLFCRQMYALNKAGIPVVNAIVRLAETTNGTALSKILKKIVERISMGETLASALQRYPRVFSSLFVNVIKAGENSGHLDEAFLQLFSYLNLEDKTKRRLKSVLRYPSFVGIAFIIAFCVINLMVIPAFSKLFERFHQQLPLPTRMIMNSSNFMLDYWVYLLLGIGVGCVLLFSYIRTDAGRMRWHYYQRKIPFVGSIISRIHAIRFAKIFSMMFRAGIPTGKSLQLVAFAMGNDYVRDRIIEVRRLIERGSGFTQAFSESELLSPLALQMLIVGEQTGQIDEMLDEVADFYERAVDYDLSRLNDAIEPVLLIGMGVMVLILALGVFLPMWDVARLMRGGA